MKTYIKPMMESELFVANENINACYHGVCNISGYVFNDTNGDGKYTPGKDEYNYYNTACEHDYWIEGQNSTLPDENAFVFVNRKRNNNGTPFWLLDDYWEGVGTPVKAWNFDKVHTTTTMDLENRPNHSPTLPVKKRKSPLVERVFHYIYKICT